MKRRLWTALLCLCLVLPLALSAAGEGTVTVAPGEEAELPAPEETASPEETAPPEEPEGPVDPGLFLDVPAEAWYATAANLASIKGLMKGTGSGYFSPGQTVTLGEVVTLAARVHAGEEGYTVPQAAGTEAWYVPGYDYCIRHQLFTGQELAMEDMPQVATRFEVVDFLDRALPDERKIAINQVSGWDIPDLAETDPYGEVVYKWVRAGIVQGDLSGAFGGQRDITRAELATILCRLTGNIPRVRVSRLG